MSRRSSPVPPGSPNSRNAASAVDTTTVDRVLTVTVGTSEVAFGVVAADGRLDGVTAGVTSQVDDLGSYYVVPSAFAVTVSSNAPWDGSCVAAENSGTATGVQVAAGRLEWRLAGTSTWTPFSPNGGSCFPSPAPGTTTFVYDVRLRVERTDGAGTFRTVITFAADP